MGNLKTILFVGGGAFVGWKVGERIKDDTIGEVVGAVVGAGAGYWLSKKV